MTAYGAVISLKNTIDYILHSSHFTLVDEPSPRMIQLAHEKLQLWQQILERLDVTSKSRSRKKVNALVAQILDAIWKFEDSLESLATYQILSQLQSPLNRVGVGRERGVFLFSIDLRRLQDEVPYFIHALNNLQKEYIPELRSMLDGLRNESNTGEPISSIIGLGGTTSEKMTGLSDLLKNVKEDLMQEYFGMHASALVGIAGIGKTALAKQIYEDPEILSHFECRAWVTVGRNPELGRVRRGILAQLYGDEKVDEYLEERLEGNKCLVVADDVWETHVFNSLIRSTPNVKSGSFQTLVLVRERDVFANFDSDIYITNVTEVRFMNEEESKDLLCHKVFGDKDLCPDQLDKAATKIAKKCEGLPLMIVTVADILSKSGNIEVEYWNDVAEERNSVFTDAYNEISEVLFPSYDYLPQYLKMPFLFMGVFPPKHDTPPSKIINMLTAEGWFLDMYKQETIIGRACFGMFGQALYG